MRQVGCIFLLPDFPLMWHNFTPRVNSSVFHCLLWGSHIKFSEALMPLSSAS
jgi:hypothetical protein